MGDTLRKLWYRNKETERYKRRQKPERETREKDNSEKDKKAKNVRQKRMKFNYNATLLASTNYKGNYRDGTRGVLARLN
jgi:hypothetical protein